MDGKSLDINDLKISQLREIFPEVFSDNKIDFQRLKLSLGEELIAKDEHYELSWAGKSESRKEIQMQTTATLNPDRTTSINFDTAQHIFIEGENLEVLRVIQKSYFGKVKMIYIDPPYNTGNDSFVYPDDYAEKQDEYKKRAGITNKEGLLNKQDLWKKNTKENGQFHSVWLSMMYPRLYLSRNLLKEDGVIFISIDENEVTNLKMLCDEIFGEENFVAKIIWEKKYSPANDAKYLSTTHEYVLLYAKNKEIWRPILEQRTDVMNARYVNSDNDPRGVWKPGGFSVKTYSANYDYPIETPFGNTVLPPKGGCWQTSKERYFELLKDNRIYFGKNGDSKPQIKQFLTEVKQGLVTKTLWSHTDVGNTQISMQEIEKIFGDKFFDTPKPTKLIRKMINIAVQKDENAIVLDFFAGSGTTAQAVIDQNNEDGGNRKFICIQLPEKIEINSNAYKAGYYTIADLTKARITKAITKISDTKSNPNIGFSSYVLSSSNFKIWNTDVQGKKDIAHQLLDFSNAEHEGNTHENMLTELLLKAGKGLETNYIKESSFFKIAELYVCFEKYTESLKEILLKEKPELVIFMSSSFTDDSSLTNLKLQLKENNIILKLI